MIRSALFLLALISCLAFNVSCGTTDRKRLQESREAYIAGDLPRAEASLFHKEVLKENDNRLIHFERLSSVALAAGDWGKAVYYLNMARNHFLSVRSESGFALLFGGDYRGNAIEFSYLHFYLALAFQTIADQGRIAAWSTPEIRESEDASAEVLVPAQSLPERFLAPSEVADYRRKAMAELMAWDSHLQSLSRSYPRPAKIYHEDLFARSFASVLHAQFKSNHEKRTAQLLAQDMADILSHETKSYPAAALREDDLKEFSKNLLGSASKDAPLFLLEAGIMPKYRVQRYHVGLSTLFGLIQDPGLRSMMEQIGLHVLLQYAPEFGLIAFSGAMAGSIGTDEDDDQPRFLTDAIDRSFGFQLQFPKLSKPAPETTFRLFLSQDFQAQDASVIEYPLPILSPLQEMLSVELEEREGKLVLEKAVTVGTQYLSILIPAVIAYRSATHENNLFKKLAILTGYFLAKKAIDAANAPDLRSWDFLPQMIVGNQLIWPKGQVRGDYQAKVRVLNSKASVDLDVGMVSLGLGTKGNPPPILIRKRIGAIP